ncbi:hypothetical protein [Liberiplasma polymorphum]|uniref:hypothetical protein n=1 Tax=Liberiplasma polymorphum TaxID=3374570 RepID=UPI003773F69B
MLVYKTASPKVAELVKAAVTEALKPIADANATNAPTTEAAVTAPASIVLTKATLKPPQPTILAIIFVISTQALAPV